MYGLSNKKDVNKQFARQEQCHTLLRWQQDIDQWDNANLQEIDASPVLHHSMASQAWKDNVFSLPFFLACHVHDPTIKVSDHKVWSPCIYMSPAQFLVKPKGPHALKAPQTWLWWQWAIVHLGATKWITHPEHQPYHWIKNCYNSYLALSFFLKLLFLFTDDTLVLLIIQCYHMITHSLSS